MRLQRGQCWGPGKLCGIEKMIEWTSHQLKSFVVESFLRTTVSCRYTDANFVLEPTIVARRTFPNMACNVRGCRACRRARAPGVAWSVSNRASKALADLVTDADVASQAAIGRIVGERFPEHAFVGEERPPDEASNRRR